MQSHIISLGGMCDRLHIICLGGLGTGKSGCVGKHFEPVLLLGLH